MTIDEIRALPRPLIPGPWGWRGYIGGSIELRTLHSGQFVVMGARRAGMQQAQPTFQVYDPARLDRPFREWWGLMHRADDLAVREVPYRTDVVSIDNADATALAALPDHVAAVDDLLGRVERALALLDDPRVTLDSVDEARRVLRGEQ